MDEVKIPEKKRKRRSHHKSRNGCVNCKRLRVKCDEITPTCGNCAKRNKECEYLVIKDEPKKKKQLQSKKKFLVSKSSPESSSSTSSSPPQSAGGGLESALESELLDHYCKHYSEFIMCFSETDSKVWAHYVPGLVKHSPHVASGLLAVSALHLDKLTGNKKDLTNYAFTKYTESLIQFKNLRSSSLNSTTSAEATFLSSVFMMMLSYRFYANIPFVSYNKHSLDLITITRGPAVVAKNLGARLAESNISQLIVPFEPADPDPYSTPPSFVDYLLEVCDAMDRLGLLAPEAEMSLASPRRHTPEDLLLQQQFQKPEPPDAPIGDMTQLTPDTPKVESHVYIYRKAIEKLNDTIKSAAFYQSPPTIMAWQMMLDNDFLQLARANYPFAKVILIYHLVAMHAIRNFFWVGDRPRNELEKLVEQLGDRWRSFYAWPMAIIRNEHFTMTTLWQYFTNDAGPFDISMLW